MQKQKRALSRSLMTALVAMLLGALVPLTAGAADPNPMPDSRLVITRLGDQAPAGSPSNSGAVAAMPQSFHFAAQGKITISSPPGDISLTINGDFAMPDRLHATVTVRDNASTDTIPPIELVVVRSQPYIHLTGSASPIGKDIWVLVDDLSGMGLLPGGAAPNLASLPPVPTQTQALSDETINGTLTTHMRTTVDATALLGGTNKSAKASTLTVDLWTSKSDNFPRRVAINGSLSIDPQRLMMPPGSMARPSSGSNVDATIALTIDFSALNVPVTITAPTSFVKLSDFIK